MACNPPRYRPAGCHPPDRGAGRAPGRYRAATTILGPGSRHAFCGWVPARPTGSSVRHGRGQGNAVGRSGVKLSGTPGAPVAGARARPSPASFPAVRPAVAGDSLPIPHAAPDSPYTRGPELAWNDGTACQMCRQHTRRLRWPGRSPGLGLRALAVLSGVQGSWCTNWPGDWPGRETGSSGQRGRYPRSGKDPREQRNH